MVSLKTQPDNSWTDVAAQDLRMSMLVFSTIKILLINTSLCAEMKVKNGLKTNCTNV